MVRERTAVGTKHSIRSAKTFIGIAGFRRSAPQFGSAAVVSQDQTVPVTNINGKRQLFEQPPRQFEDLFFVTQTKGGAGCVRDYLMEVLTDLRRKECARRKVHCSSGCKPSRSGFALSRGQHPTFKSPDPRYYFDLAACGVSARFMKHTPSTVLRCEAHSLSPLLQAIASPHRRAPLPAVPIGRRSKIRPSSCFGGRPF